MEGVQVGKFHVWQNITFQIMCLALLTERMQCNEEVS
jgi:hypothetical protein